MGLQTPPALASAQWGMTVAARRMDAAAHDVAVRSAEATPTDGAGDLASSFVEATVLAPVAYALNAKVASAAAATQRALIDILA